MKAVNLFGAVLAGVLLTLPSLVQAQLSYFPIATNGVAISFASDGSNYLVGVEIPATTNISAQMIDSDGNKVGSLIETGRSGISPTVAFDGTNYLMIWEDDGLDTLTNGSYQVYGQFISKAGTTNSAPFDISGLGIQFDGIKTIAFGGGKYLVTYSRLDGSNKYIAGRMVYPNGTVGSEFRISTGYGKASDVAFDDTNFLVVWCEDSADTEIRGRLVTPGGFVGHEISINASAAPSDNPKSVAFDGTNYLVVWNDEVGGAGVWDCFGQLIDTSGNTVGGVITLTSDPGPQMATTVAFDGDNYMAAWVDMQNGTNWDMYAQYINTSGSLVDAKFALSTAAGNQLGGVGFANGNYLVLVNNGVEMGEGGISQSDSATGAFIIPSVAPPELFFSDDFNDNAKDPAKWGDDFFVDDGANSSLEEINGRLEFSAGSAGSLSDGIVRPWIGSFGSYTQNWEAAVDVHLGTVSLPDNADISMFLAVVEEGDPEFVDHFSMELYANNDSYLSTQRTYSVDGAYNNNELDLGRHSTADQDGRLRIAFDASSKTLTGSFNGVSLGGMDVDDVATSWQMNNNSTFMIVLGGSMWGSNFTNDAHEVYADNFELRTGNDLEYLLTINNGSGSGAYINTAGVSITAAAAPSGQVFDHWAGSTQYLANAASSTTTVTMPAQAITITAVYKLLGDSAGDDFNDNSKNILKWSNDLSFYGTNTNASLQEVSGRLELRKESGIDANGVIRPWIESVGSYTQNWEIVVDTYLGNITLSENNAWVDLSLAVFNINDNSDLIDISIDLSRSDNQINRGYKMKSKLNATNLTEVPNYGYASTANIQGTLKIAYDAATKVLTASYNGNILGWVDVDAPGSEWEMTDGDIFGFALVGDPGTESLSVSAGEAYFDNFRATGTVAPPLDWDGNGLPDAWEWFYFSGTVVNPNALCANGFNTIMQAYIAGFSPTDPDAFFSITGIDGNMIEWTAESGRVYSVYWTTNLMTGFQTLGTNYTGGAITDAVHSAESKCFYKIDVRLED